MKYAIVAVATLLAGLLGVALASCGTGGASSAGPVPTAGAGPTVPSSDTTPTVLTGGTDTKSAEQKRIRYEVWFHRGEQLFLVSRTSEFSPRVGAAAMEHLLVGPSDAERAEGIGTQIPDGTELLGLSIDKGIARVDLTSEFESGGGSASMSMRLAQVVYTLTQFPTVEGVRFALDGETIDVLGGEGVVIDHPLTRKDYAELLPAIVVESPAIGEAVGNPVTVSGNANVFEANVTVIVLDASGKEIARTFTTATCGTGCRGTFSVTVPYKVAEGKEHGTIVVQDDDAAGTGQPPHQVEIPVLLEST